MVKGHTNEKRDVSAATVEGLREEVIRLKAQLAAEQSGRKDTLPRGSLATPPTPPEERTLQTGGAASGGGAGRTIRTPSGLSPGVTEKKGELSQLTQQLKVFCREAQRISLPM